MTDDRRQRLRETLLHADAGVAAAAQYRSKARSALNRFRSIHRNASGVSRSRSVSSATASTTSSAEGLDVESLDMLAEIVDRLSLQDRMALIERLRERRESN